VNRLNVQLERPLGGVALVTLIALETCFRQCLLLPAATAVMRAQVFFTAEQLATQLAAQLLSCRTAMFRSDVPTQLFSCVKGLVALITADALSGDGGRAASSLDMKFAECGVAE
jgi:hypothetical protein